MTGAPHDGVGEDDEPGPRDWRIPRPERLDVRERRRLGHDHDRQTDQRPVPLQHRGYGVASFDRHVIRTRYEQPRGAGVPTPLPRINTLCVLPSPPGMMSVLRCRESFARFAMSMAETANDSRHPVSNPNRKYV